MGQQAVVNVGLNAAGINQQELMAAPFAITENTVAGNAGRIFHNGKALAGQLVKSVDLPTLGRLTMATIGFAIVKCLLT